VYAAIRQAIARPSDAPRPAPQGKPAHQQGSCSDQADTGHLPCGRRAPERGGADREHEHRRDAARDRVHDRGRRDPVGRDEQGEVEELKRPAGEQVRPQGPVHVPERPGDRGEDDLSREQRHRRRRPRVAPVREQDVPERVHASRARASSRVEVGMGGH
jgi:hypothetical protein